ncbi:MAG: ferrochelatase [Nevskia sp.]|nr:ferrochelatase [Nevskia sp.]
MNSESAHRAVAQTGVLLVNLGTPDAPTPGAIRRYLAQFLADRRVVEIPRALWLPILYLFILPLRPRRLAHAYASIWRDDGSPLLAISRQQAAALRVQLTRKLGREVPVALAMTYGQPSIATALAELEAQNVRHLLLLPLFPQYSGSTTAAVLDALFAQLSQRRWPPELRTVNSYHDDATYIEALAASVRGHWHSAGRGEHLLMSFHGIPQRYVQLGDPYYCQCLKTARLLAEALELPPDYWSASFQSRFGKAPWVQPYSDQRIKQLAQQGIKNLDVICPGFAADCLETLEEITLRYGADFVEAGGTALRYIPALNAEPAHIEALAGIVSGNLEGWLLPQVSAAEIDARLQHTRAALPAFSGVAAASDATPPETVPTDLAR